jgi:hypothetical protein
MPPVITERPTRPLAGVLPAPSVAHQAEFIVANGTHVPQYAEYTRTINCAALGD